MFETLVPWYQKELSFLKREAMLFARRYPQLAARLNLQENDAENLDPHADRLIQSVALLAARVRVKIEDKFPELSDTLIDLLFPHYLAPIPSLTLVQFQLDREQGRITTRYPIPRGSVLHSRPIEGVPCRYRTCYDVDVWPLSLDKASIDSPARPLPRRGPASGIVSALRFRLSSPTGTPIARMELDRLRLHLDGEPAVSHGLYEMLLRHALHVELAGKDAAGKEVVVPLRPSCLKAVGFDDVDGLLPYPRNSFLGFRLLQELFVLPEKFLFVDLTGLEAVAQAGIQDTMEVHVYCKVAPPFRQAVEPANLRLGCTPVVNLFERLAEPITVDHRKGEYLVIPDVRNRLGTEVWMIREVTSQPLEGGESAGITPLFAFGHGSRVDGTQLTWQARRKVAEDGAGEFWLTIGLPDRISQEPRREVLSIRVLCTNRDLPASLRVGGDARGDFFLDGAPGFLKAVALRQPTPPLRPDTGRAAHWRLIAHLALNQVSLLADDGAALRGMLELYEPANNRAARQQIAAIREVRSRQTDRLLDGSLLRGMEVDMTLDSGAFVGTGHYLFSAVLDRFLGMYAAVNSFTRLQVSAAADSEDRTTFPPRAGQQMLL